MPGLLGDLGSGLINAGAALSPQVMQGQQQAEAAALDNKRRMAAQLVQQVVAGVQNGSIPPEQGRAVLQRMGIDLPVGPDIQTQQAQTTMQTNQRALEFLRNRQAPPNGAPAGPEGAGAPPGVGMGLGPSLSDIPPELMGAPAIQNWIKTQDAAAKLRRDSTGLPQGMRADLSKYTPDSIKTFEQTGKMSDLVPVEKPGGRATQEWSEPFQLQGAQVQKNLTTGEIRTAVTREPQVRVSVGGGQGKPPAGYQWGPADADGSKTLAPIKGGPADKGSGAALSPDGIDLRANQVLSGEKGALANLGRGRQGAEDVVRITNRAAELLRERGGDPSEIGRRVSEFRANSNSLSKLTQSYDAITAFEQTAVRNGERLIELADKTDATGVPVIEKWIKAGRQATGDPDVAQFNAQLQVYRTEAGRILTNPNLSGQLTDSARKEVEHFMGPGASAKQIKGVVNLLRNDFDSRKKTLEDQINTTRDRIQRNVGPGEGGKPPAAGGAPKKIASESDYNALPAGTEYIAPDGSTRRKK